MRKALIVGIDYYQSISQLYGCVNDSYAVKSVLERNSDGTLNFDIMHDTASNANQSIVGAHLIWPPSAFILGHHAHEHLASLRMSIWPQMVK